MAATENLLGSFQRQNGMTNSKLFMINQAANFWTFSTLYTLVFACGSHELLPYLLFNDIPHVGFITRPLNSCVAMFLVVISKMTKLRLPFLYSNCACFYLRLAKMSGKHTLKIDVLSHCNVSDGLNMWTLEEILDTIEGRAKLSWSPLVPTSIGGSRLDCRALTLVSLAAVALPFPAFQDLKFLDEMTTFLPTSDIPNRLMVVPFLTARVYIWLLLSVCKLFRLCLISSELFWSEYSDVYKLQMEDREKKEMIYKTVYTHTF